MPPKKDYFQWWKERIQTVKGLKDEATRLSSITTRRYEVGSWAILKLGLFAYYVDLYTSIIKARFSQAYYLDLFSGPGLNRIQGTGDMILGSPLLADRVPKPLKKFDQLFLIEKDQADANSLRKLLPKAEVLHEDVNNGGLDLALKSILQGTSRPILALVDPEGLDVHWATLAKLLQTWSDVLVNYQPTSVRRVVASSRNRPAYETSLNLYFGGTEWKNCKNDDELFDLYLKKLGQHKDVVIPIRVNGPGGFYYYLIIAVRRTKGAQEWIQAVERGREKIEQASSTDAERFLDIYKGTQLTFG